MTGERPHYRFVRVLSTPKPTEIAIIKSILDNHDIPYFIKGENFGTVYGPADGLSSMDVMVRQEDFEIASELLMDFIRPRKQS